MQYLQKNQKVLLNQTNMTKPYRPVKESRIWVVGDWNRKKKKIHLEMLETPEATDHNLRCPNPPFPIAVYAY